MQSFNRHPRCGRSSTSTATRVPSAKPVQSTRIPRRPNVSCRVAAIEEEVITTVPAFENVLDQSTSAQQEHAQSSTPQSGLPYVPAFKLDDVVYATVTSKSQKGVRAGIMYHEGLIGFMPADQAPITLEEWSQSHARPKPRAPLGMHAHHVPLQEMEMLVGHTRPFKVTAVPTDMELNGRGPLLSAYKYDKDLLWARVAQLFQLSTEEPFALSVKVLRYNPHGLVVSLLGIEAFIHNSHICRRPGMTRDEVAEQLLGQDIEVAMLQMEPYGSVKLSETLARKQRLSKPGTIVSGEVSSITAFGAFVYVEGFESDALLHNSCISNAHVRHAADVFEVGEKVYVAVLEVEENKTRVSTRVLEQSHGQMMRDKAGVFQRAAAGPPVIQLPDPAEERAMRDAERQLGGREDGRMATGERERGQWSGMRDGGWQAQGDRGQQAGRGTGDGQAQGTRQQWGEQQGQQQAAVPQWEGSSTRGSQRAKGRNSRQEEEEEEEEEEVESGRRGRRGTGGRGQESQWRDQEMGGDRGRGGRGDRYGRR